MMVTITLELPQEVERKRQAAIQQTRQILDQLDALEPKLTQEEIIDEMHKPSVGL